MTTKELEALILQMEEMDAPEQDIADVVAGYEQEQNPNVVDPEEEEAKTNRKEERRKRREERKKDKAPKVTGVDAEQEQLTSELEQSTTEQKEEDLDSDALKIEEITYDTKTYLDGFDDVLDITGSVQGGTDEWSQLIQDPNFVAIYDNIFNKVRNAEGFLGPKLKGTFGNNGDFFLNPSDLPEGEEGDRIFLNYIGVGAVQQGKMGDHGLRKNGHKGYYGASEAYADQLDEVYYIKKINEHANVVAAKMPGLNIEDMNPAEIIDMYYSGNWVAQSELDEQGEVTFDVEFNLETYTTIRQQEMEADLGTYMGQIMTTYEQAERKKQLDLQEALSGKYVEEAYSDSAVSKANKKAQKQAERKAKTPEFKQQINKFADDFIKQNPNATQQDLDEALEAFAQPLFNEIYAPVEALVNTYVKDHIYGNEVANIPADPEWSQYTVDYIAGFDAKAAEFGQKFIETYNPQYGEVGEALGVWDNDMLENVANKFNENGFAALSGPDKKAYIEITVDNLIKQAEDEGIELSPEDETRARQEFFGFFYNRLITEDTGQISADGNPIQRSTAFALKDIAQLTLDFYEEQKEEYIRLRVDAIVAEGEDGEKAEAQIRELFDSTMLNVRVTPAEGFEDGFPDELQLLKQYSEDVIANPESADAMGASEFWSGVFSRRGYKYIPFVGSFIDMNDQFKISAIAKKPKNERTPSENMLLAMVSVKQQSDGIVGEISNWYNGGQIAGDMIPFVGEFIATGPAFRSAKTAFQTAMRTQVLTRLNNIKNVRGLGLIKPTTGTLVLDKSINGASTLFGLGAQTTFTFPRVGYNAAQNMTPEMMFAFSTEADELIAHLDAITGTDEEGEEMGLSKGMGTAESWFKGFGTQYAELFTERIGTYLPGLGGRARKHLIKPGSLLDDIANKELWKRLTLGHYLRRYGFDNLDDFYNFSRKHAGWNGFMGESFEELINFPMQNIIMGDRPVLEGIFKYDQFGNNLGLDTEGLTDMAIGIGSISLFGGGGGAVMGRFGPKKPTYYVNHQRFTDFEKAKAYLEKLQSTNALTAELDIEVRHDYVAYDEFAEILEANGLSADQIKTVSGNTAQGNVIPTEVEVLDRVQDPKDRKTLLETSDEIEQLENEKVALEEADISKEEKVKKRKEIQGRINELFNIKSSIIAPIRKKIAERRSKKAYKDTLKKVRKISSKLGLENKLKITEVKSKAEGRRLALANRFSLIEFEGEFYSMNEDGSRGEKSNVDPATVNKAIQEFEQAHGYAVPGKDGGPSELILHEDAAINTGGENVASHEFLHFYLQKTFQDNPELSIAVSKAFKQHIQNVDPRTIRDSEFRNRLLGYMEKGEAVVAEESITLFLDAIANGSIQYNETTMDKLGDIVKRIAHRLGYKVKFKTGKDVYNFLVEFNDAIQSGEFSEGLIQSMQTGIEIDGQILAQAESVEEKIDQDLAAFNEIRKEGGLEEMDRKTYRDIAMSIPGYKFSKPSTAKQAEIDNLAKNADGKSMDKATYDTEGVVNAYDAIISGTQLDALIVKGINFPIYGKSKEAFIEAVKFGTNKTKRSLSTIIFDFNPGLETTDQGSFGLSGYINGLLNFIKGDISNEFKEEAGTLSIDRTVGSEGATTIGDRLVATKDANVEKFEEKDLSIGAAEQVETDGLVKFKDTANLDKTKVRSTVANATVDVTGMSYKDIKKLVVGNNAVLAPILEEVAGKFGIPTAKINKKADLNTSQRASAQEYIKNNTQSLIDILPEGQNLSGIATGVANTKLGEFYVKGERAEFAKGATAAGKPVQSKRSDISVQEFQEFFGIKPDGTFDNNKKYDGAIRELTAQAAMITANQEIREFALESGSIAQKAAANMADGKSQVMFSNPVPERLLPVYNQKYGNLIAAVSTTNTGSLEAVTSAVERVFTKEDGFRPANIKKLATVIFTRVKQYNNIVEKHKLSKDQLVNFDKPLTDYLLEQKDLETFDISLQKAVEAQYKKNGKEYPKDKNGKNIPIGNTLLEEGNIIRHRAMIPTIGKALAEQGLSPAEIAEVMLSLRGMYSGLSRIGDGRYISDKQGGIVENPDWKPGKKNRKQVYQSVGDYLVDVRTIPGLENLQNINPETGKPSQAYYLNGVKIKSTEFSDNVEAFMKEQDSDPAATFKGRVDQANKFRNAVETILDSYWKQVESGSSNMTLVDFAAAITMMGSGMESVLRKSAPAEYKMVGIEAVIAKGKRQGKSMKDIARYEHAISQLEVANKILHSYMTNGSLNSEVWEGFKVAVISVEMDDVMKEIGMNTKSPLDGKPRYFNEKSFGHPAIKALQSIDPAKQGKDTEFVGKNFVAAMNAVKAGSVKDLQILNSAYRGIKLSKAADPKGASVWDFDDTLAQTKSDVLFTAPDGTKGKLNAEDFAKQGADLLSQGYVFDFSEFNKVTGGKPGPLFDKALERAKRLGTKDTFILTARAPEAQQAIHEFLKGIGLDIPIENITGLANSTGKAKADWIAQNLIAEGYNDLYFADDALGNVDAVKTMFDLFDIKGKVEQAKIKFSKAAPKKISEIIEGGEELSRGIDIALEESMGIDSRKTFSRAKARQRGKGKGKFKFFIPPSAEDFAGLIYPMLGKGEIGNQHHAWFKKNLFDPFSRGVRALNAAQQSVAVQKRALKVPKKLKKTIPGLEFTYEHAVRVFNWNRSGYEVPGLSRADLNTLVRVVNNDMAMQAYANSIDSIAGQAGGLLEPADHWLSGSTSTDLMESVESMRETMLEEWTNNKNAIFTPEVLNKLEAAFGSNYREALEDVLYRMETGSTRSFGQGRLMNGFMKWVHGSVGATMFFNARSAVLQMISNVNFVNWSDNNPLKAAAAFANQKQYWTDVSMIFNSDFLKQRRGGLQTDLNAAELLKDLQQSDKPMQAAIAHLLRIGFTPTQIADSFAIATGGATFYRNRIKSHVESGMSQAEAESQAFEDMMEIAEKTQQSSRPDMISQQQASPIGKVILAFQNTPMQYARLIKRATQDLINGRGDATSNISKILYYGFIQNVIFYSMQTALFSMMFGDDEDEDQRFDQKADRIVNGMMDSLLRGSGVGGAAVSTLKNMVLEFMAQEEKADDGKFYTEPDHAYTVIEALNLSPPIGIKARKLYSSLQTWEFNDDVIEYMDTKDIDNPVHDAWTGAAEAITNVPLNRLYSKLMNVRAAMDSDNENYERVAMLLGWSRWNFGIQNQDVMAAKGEIKEIKAKEAEERREKKKEERRIQKQEEDKVVVEKNIEEQDKQRQEGKEEKDIRCAHVKSNGKRCSNKVLPGKTFCTIHEKVEQRSDGKEAQCTHIKSDGKRCKMKTKNKSGKCYYHD